MHLVERNSRPNDFELINAYRVGKHSPMDLVELAREIQNADIAFHSQSGKLALIVDQIRFLQSQAHQILKDTKTDQMLHRAACNFKKIPGKMYYLYERDSGQAYFSMLSPEVPKHFRLAIQITRNLSLKKFFYLQEWGMNLSHKFIGGYRLEHDQTWTPVDRLNEVDEKKQITRKFLETGESENIFKRSIRDVPELMDSKQ